MDDEVLTVYNDCSCSRIEHLHRYMLVYDSVFLSVHLDHYFPWYKRIWYAALYLLGKDPPNGHWDVHIQEPAGCLSLIALLMKGINAHESV